MRGVHEVARVGGEGGWEEAERYLTRVVVVVIASIHASI